MTKNKNFSGQETPSIIDTEYEGCNFSQPAPVDSGGGVMVGVRLFPGDDTPRTFTECNMVNCEPPPGSTLTNCNTTIRASSIVASSDTLTIDGVEATLETKVDRIYGRLKDGAYEYKDTPTDIAVEND